MRKRNYLLKVRASRKAYILIYLMIFLVIFSLIYLSIKGYELKVFSIYFSLIFIISCIFFMEIHRLKDWWAITDTSFVQSAGILNKNIREIGFSSISDVDLDQPLIKRILNYGNINLRLFLNETSMTVVNINNPEHFITELQSLLSANRRTKNE